jgi:hypothetical protein
VPRYAGAPLRVIVDDDEVLAAAPSGRAATAPVRASRTARLAELHVPTRAWRSRRSAELCCPASVALCRFTDTAAITATSVTALTATVRNAASSRQPNDPSHLCLPSRHLAIGPHPDRLTQHNDQ